MRDLFKRFSIVAALLYSSLTVAAMTPIEQTLSSTPNGVILRIAGSNTLGAELLPNMMLRYMQAKGVQNVQIVETAIENEYIVKGFTAGGQPVQAHIAAHGSGTGFKGIDAGQADIAAASRPIKSSEAALFPSYAMTSFDSEHVVGIDGLAIIVHPDVPLDFIEIDSLGKIFSGEVTNWSQLQADYPEYTLPNLQITVHARDSNSGTFDSFKSMVLSRGYELISSSLRYESNQVLSSTVSRMAGSVGFTAVATIGNAKALAVKDAGTIAMNPERLLIAAEDYPLSRRLYLYTTTRTNRHVDEFIAFASSKAGQDVVEQVGFISQNIIKLPQAVYSDMPDGYRRVVGRAERLSVNFRFRDSQRDLDNKALVDLERLAQFMRQDENAEREILLFGFADGGGDESRAILLSEIRTLAVRKALREYGIRARALTGYGSLNQVAKGDASERNNRVEVWIKE